MLAMASGSPAVSASAASIELAIELGLVAASILKSYIGSYLVIPAISRITAVRGGRRITSHASIQPHLAAPCLTVPRCFLASTRFALAARLGLVLIRFGLADMGPGDQLRQPRAGFLAIGFLGAVLAGGDDDLAAAVIRLPASSLSRA